MGQWGQPAGRVGKASGGTTGTSTPTTTSVPSAIPGVDGLEHLFSFVPDSSAALSFPYLFPSW